MERSSRWKKIKRIAWVRDKTSRGYAIYVASPSTIRSSLRLVLMLMNQIMLFLLL